jgi:hypothetical protein
MMAGGVAMVGVAVDRAAGPLVPGLAGVSFGVLLGMVMFPVLRRWLIAVLWPRPRTIMATVVSAITAMPVLDAAVCVAARPDERAYALVTIFMIVPVFVLRRWFPAS